MKTLRSLGLPLTLFVLCLFCVKPTKIFLTLIYDQDGPIHPDVIDTLERLGVFPGYKWNPNTRTSSCLITELRQLYCS